MLNLAQSVLRLQRYLPVHSPHVDELVDEKLCDISRWAERIKANVTPLHSRKHIYITTAADISRCDGGPSGFSDSDMPRTTVGGMLSSFAPT